LKPIRFISTFFGGEPLKVRKTIFGKLFFPINKKEIYTFTKIIKICCAVYCKKMGATSATPLKSFTTEVISLL